MKKLTDVGQTMDGGQAHRYIPEPFRWGITLYPQNLSIGGIKMKNKIFKIKIIAIFFYQFVLIYYRLYDLQM